MEFAAELQQLITVDRMSNPYVAVRSRGAEGLHAARPRFPLSHTRPHVGTTPTLPRRTAWRRTMPPRGTS